jgi:hypothetical protein
VPDRVLGKYSASSRRRTASRRRRPSMPARRTASTLVARRCPCARRPFFPRALSLAHPLPNAHDF